MLKLQYFVSKEPTHLKRPWCWGRLKTGGEGCDREWDGWMASPSQWTWVWTNSGRWWGTGRPGVLQSLGLWRVRHHWVPKQQQGALPAIERQRHLPSASEETGRGCYSCCPMPPEGVQGGVRHSVLQGICWDRSLDSYIFSGAENDHDPNPCIPSYRKAPNPFMMTSASRD